MNRKRLASEIAHAFINLDERFRDVKESPVNQDTATLSPFDIVWHCIGTTALEYECADKIIKSDQSIDTMAKIFAEHEGNDIQVFHYMIAERIHNFLSAA